nr:MAG TPA: hypothetical protein [Caudoviricetes sp.]
MTTISGKQQRPLTTRGLIFIRSKISNLTADSITTN